MTSEQQQKVAAELLRRGGQTYAEEAGIKLEDKPAPLYQLLVLSLLLSARIGSDIALAAAQELFRAGFTTPGKMSGASWQQRVDALGRGGYRRYDERTSTMLGEGADWLLDRHGGDVRRMAQEARDDTERLRALIKETKGIGDVGAAIFLREVQGVWPAVRPFLDTRTVKGATRLGLPDGAGKLASLVSGEDLPRLAAGLVRVAKDKELAEAVLGTDNSG